MTVVVCFIVQTATTPPRFAETKKSRTQGGGQFVRGDSETSSGQSQVGRLVVCGRRSVTIQTAGCAYALFVVGGTFPETRHFQELMTLSTTTSVGKTYVLIIVTYHQ